MTAQKHSLLFLGDVVGETGRNAVTRYLPSLKRATEATLVIVNGENAAHGFGLTPGIAEEIFSAGADVITTGNHVWDQKTSIDYIRAHPHIARPLNYPESVGGRGVIVFDMGKGALPIVIINAMGRLFMPGHPLQCPFMAIDAALESYQLGKTAAAIFVDFHAETTSEKAAMAHYLDGRVTAVIGTHTHVPTADARVLPGGTAFQTDAGMCGDYQSVVGMTIAVAVQRFLTPISTEKLAPTRGPGSIAGAWVHVGPSGHATRIESFQIGGALPPRLPASISLEDFAI